MKNLIACAGLFCALLTGNARADEFSAARRTGQDRVEFDLKLWVYRIETRCHWETECREHCSCLPAPHGGCHWHCHQYCYPTRVCRDYEYRDYEKPVKVALQFPADAALREGQSEEIKLTYHHGAGNPFSRYDAYAAEVKSSHYSYQEPPVHRFQNREMPDSYVFQLAKGEGRPDPTPPAPKPDEELLRFIQDNMVFRAYNDKESGKGIMSVSIKPEVLDKKMISDIQYEAQRIPAGSSMAFGMVKGKRDLANLPRNVLLIPLYQELNEQNSYLVKLKVRHDFKKPEYQWSEEFALTLPFSKEPALTQGLNPAKMRALQSLAGVVQW
ncbi:MAG: hypothetical protein HY921_09840 [Elusimicrobia bacterium]|nr:hypothetical protein [Elusimicrobiota bacterium]